MNLTESIVQKVQISKQNIARVRNCPDVTLFLVFVSENFCLFVFHLFVNLSFVLSSFCLIFCCLFCPFYLLCFLCLFVFLSLCLFVFLPFCNFVILFFCLFDLLSFRLFVTLIKVSEGSQVSKGTICVKILKWLSLTE